ncbi:MAG TPA: dienelactone hydrolase family protein [Acidimicrobiia bacterium]|nr:dienelactone hydrolase family protein [Acidimicrobiia bacterium]
MTTGTLPFFFASPAGDPPWPGVLVVHEGNGMSPQLLRVCERLAAAGYAALAPDLFARSGGSEAADFTTLIGALQPDEVLADLTEARDRLHDLGGAKIGITGFCLGGSISYRAALADLDLAGAAPFYGAHVARELGEPTCPVLAFFGGRDEYIPEADLAAVQAHHPDDVVVYPDAQHGFMRDGSPSYHPAAAADAWARLLTFFARHLR